MNAAGIVALGNVEQLDFATWRTVLAVNLDGAFLGCKYAFPLLAQERRRHRQSVVGVGPGRRAQSRRLQCLEGRAVAAVEIGRAARRAAEAAGALQRRVPGFRRGADGRRHRANRARSGSRQSRRWRTTFRSAASAKPAEVADLCVYLLSDEAAFITGADLPIDGGLTAGARPAKVGTGFAKQSSLRRLRKLICGRATKKSYPRISAVTCAATERDRPCRS